MEGFLYEDETYAIRGAIYEVSNTLGCGFWESVYQEALERELALRNIPFASQVEIKIDYKGAPLTQTYRADIVCYDKIILELKAVNALLPEHEAPLQNYLRATKMRVGFLVNFGHYPKTEIKRLIV